MNKAEQLSRERIEAFNDAFINRASIEIDGETHVIVSHDIEPVYRTVKHKYETDKGLMLEEIAMFDFEPKST